MLKLYKSYNFSSYSPDDVTGGAIVHEEDGLVITEVHSSNDGATCYVDYYSIIGFSISLLYNEEYQKVLFFYMMESGPRKMNDIWSKSSNNA